MKSFDVSRLPALHFGVGNINLLWKLSERFGKRVALITGGGTLERSNVLQQVLDDGHSRGYNLIFEKILEEPSSTIINAVVERLQSQRPEVVIAVGGGSVLDAGKAISAMLGQGGGDVTSYLEGIGTLKPTGAKIPFIAIPTTAGTGSEATKNAVLSEVGDHGYKKSLRHDNFVPDVALIDPELMLGCPQDITARCGMDAFTQLLESYLSKNANPFTDALALQGLELVAASLRKVCRDGLDLNARSNVALAAYLSGVTLANAGLGTVHGIAGPFGGFYKIAHGHLCSALMTPVNRLTIKALRKLDTKSVALKKYAQVGRLFCGKHVGDEEAVDALLEVIAAMAKEFNLSKIDYPQIDIKKVADASENKANPVPLAPKEILEVLTEICT